METTLQSLTPCQNRTKTNPTLKTIRMSALGILLSIVMLALTQSVSAQNACTSCTLGYPDNSNLPKSAVVFNEPEVLQVLEPGAVNCGITPTSIKAWYSDEHAITLGVRRVIVKTSAGTTTTDYTVSPYPGSPTCLSTPAYGTLATSGDQSGNDVADGGGRPLRPVLYLTDLTVNGPTSRAGDWQQGGTPYNPSSICGSWKAAVRTVDYTVNPVKVTVQPDADPSQNHVNFGNGATPPSGYSDEGYGTIVEWKLSDLNLIPGHVYRIQVMVHDGDQNKTGGDVGSACTTLNNVGSGSLFPDFNITYVNVPVPGDVSTNDITAPGATYGTPAPVAGNPAGGSITMNSNGTYSFVSPNVGVYKYLVPVCAAGQTSCPSTLLTITVLGPNINNNPPVANTDIAVTQINTPVTLKSLANDRAGNPGGSLNPGSVTVTVSPLHGTASVNAATGDITYTPANNYEGQDTLTYNVCDNSAPALCATALQIITIRSSAIGNTTLAADDYAYTSINTAVSGNVKTNDTDPEGNAQTVTAQTTTVAGKGTLVLAADGSFTFTPVNGFTGPVSFVYTTTDNGAPAATAKATLYILVSPPSPQMYPDFNVTYVNVSVSGNVSTNDVVPAGTTYGTSPTPVAGNPAGGTLTMNSNGTYSFISPNVGVYKYNVPVCVPGQSAPCPTTLLTITVLGPNVDNNPPVANTDIASTKINTPVTLPSLANDRAGNPGGSLNPASVTVIVNPLHGTASVNAANGDITYTPAAGFTGNDTLTYRVCDNSFVPLCATALQIITVNSNTNPNTTLAADDYAYTPKNVAVSGNVKTNDTDPEGNTQTVTAQTTTVAGKGTLVLAADGSYTFTPVNGFTGPVSFPYTTTDNGTPQASAQATLYILVSPDLPHTNPDFNSTYVNVSVAGNVSTNDVVPAGTTYGTSPTLVSSPAGSTANITMNSNGTYVFIADKVGVYTYDVPVCMPGSVAPCPPTKLVITVLDATTLSNSPVANVDIAITNYNIPVTLKTLANDAAGNPAFSLVPSTVTVTVNPLHGTASVNAANGDITYTPAMGYSGSDTLTYQVCDNQVPSKCATAKQVIIVKPVLGGNTTDAADDYLMVRKNQSGAGNVKTNDSDAENNFQTVAAQNTTIAGKGTLVLAADGSYTFTPVNGFTGPIDFPYSTCDNGIPQACASATLHVLVVPDVPYTNPDFNSTFVNVAVPGNVSTNDFVPAGTTYGTSPTLASSPAGSVASITMNTDGTYSFVANMIGVYTYDVPVCIPSYPCSPTKLVITVLGANSNVNSPVANVDIASTKVNVPVTLPTLANDAAGNPSNSLVPSSVVVTIAPQHGSASVNAATGDITYTPAANYVGSDTLTYQVCDNQNPAKCATAKQVIIVKPVGANNSTSAADDYKITLINTAATGNVKTNDNDAEGDAQTVAAQTTTIAGKGTLVLQADGSYTFTPANGFTGPIDYIYTTCDNGVPQACASATLHILVKPIGDLPDLTPSIFNDGGTVAQNNSRDNVIRIFNIGPGPTLGQTTFTIPKMLPAFEITINPTKTFEDVFGGITLNNADFTIVEQATRYVVTTKPGVIIQSGGYIDLGLEVKAVGIRNSTGNLSVSVVFGTGGGETPINNNRDTNIYAVN